jgi:valyl-tRNA synthetase
VYGDDQKAKASAVINAKKLLADILKLLHPIIPFVTEKIYQSFNPGTIMLEAYPEKVEINGVEEVAVADKVIGFVQKVRETLLAYEVDKKSETTLFADANILNFAEIIKKLTGVKNICVSENVGEGTVKIASNLGTAYLKISISATDRAKEKEKAEKERAKILNEIARSQGMLNNQGFMQKASETLINAEREKLVKYNNELKLVEEKLVALGE